MRSLAASLALLVAFAACSARTPTPTLGPTIPPATFAATAESVRPHPTPTPVHQALSASDGRLTVEVQLSTTTVEPGGKVTVEVTIRNRGSGTSVISPGFCDGKATVGAELPLPQEPPGRTWNGFAAQYKAFVLAHKHTNGGDVAYVQGLPDRLGVTPFFCPPSASDGSVTLQPGDTITTSITLAAELTPGVPALPGDMPFTVIVFHDPGPMPTGPCPCPRPPEQQLTVSGTITIAGVAPRILSEGEVVDAMLSDARFAEWLTKEPQSTWDIANLSLETQPGAQGIVPNGPSWRIDLFREIGVPRHWAIGFVDPFSGELLNLAFCNIPCAR
jgi:hypothetical protein